MDDVLFKTSKMYRQKCFLMQLRVFNFNFVFIVGENKIQPYKQI